MLENYRKAFKAYDIRGAYPQNIDEHFSHTMGRAIGKYILGIKDKIQSAKKLLIGCDVRLQNPALIAAFEAWLKETCPAKDGVKFSNITYANFEMSEKYPCGVCSTPALYYLGQGDFDLGIAFTASHNPPGDVGMKFFDKNVKLLATEMLREMFKKEYTEDDEMQNLELTTQMPQIDTMLVYKVGKLYEMMAKKWNGLKKHHHFVVDFSNGAAVSMEKTFFMDHASKHHTIDLINDVPDGNFASHYSDTQDYENYEQLIHTVKEKRANFGIMFDGDADRIGIVGPDWKIVGGDLLTAMIAKQILLEQHSDFKNIVLYETMSSQMVKEVVGDLGGEARMTRVGRYFINQELKACGGIFAGESSGHFLFAEMGGYEMPLLALYYICKEMEEYSTWEEFIWAYKKYFKSPIISLKVTDKDGALKKVQDKYADYEMKFVDGISVYAPDFWFNLRPSNTEDKIKFTVEANSKEKMNQVVEELRGTIGS